MSDRPMPDPDTFTGERFIPGAPGEIAYEHCHRYAFARELARGRRVLDAACGTGYGSALMADVAASVVGIDIDAGVVADASAAYASRQNLRFEAASVSALPLPQASVDLVVSFETIEHIGADDQARMLQEFARVLAPGGLLVLSSPNRVEYSDARSYRNPFHVRELDRDELAQLLGVDFAAQRWYRQRRYLGSALWADVAGPRFEALAGNTEAVRLAAVPQALYFVVVAAREQASLPAELPSLSLYADAGDSEWERIDNETRELIRLYGEVGQRDRDLAQLAQRVHALAQTLGERDARIAELERGSNGECDELRRQIEAQERLIGYYQSLRWWLTLPWLRLRRAWERIRSA
ncbi:MAG: methyltransferase domain-containing protein [Betaproteobacteria bacterium]|nr:methyltransferase domain-containing protein [Betaproteobacteria bacterium]